VCRALLEHPGIEFAPAAITGWTRTPDGRQLHAGDRRQPEIFPVVVLATAADLCRFEAAAHLPLRTLQGQISTLPATAASARLRLPVCGDGYLAPALDGRHSLGATYRPDATALDVDAAGHCDNLGKIRTTDAALAAALGQPDPNALDGRAGLRCVTPDYLPLVGPAPQLEEFLEALAPLRRDARTALPRTGRHWPGLYLNAGHGSRGLAYAPLCAALLADLIEGRPRPLARDLVRALSPARFLVRDLQRRRR
jgi:tRNA 5-methylaminomethyl-2-thiouridine biosynthesis bifunctional protein